MCLRVWLVVLGCLAVLDASDIDVTGDSEIRLNLMHSLDNGETWTERGNVNLPSTRSANPIINQDSLTLVELEKLRELCSSSKLYLLKVRGEGGLGEHRSFASACGLLESELEDNLAIHLDWRGNLVAVQLSVSPPEPFPRKDSMLTGSKSSLAFDTRVVTQVMENGPSPDTAAFIQKVEEEKVRKMSGETTDNRSFISKYWMYIVPVFIFLAINSAAGPENGGGR